MNAMFLKDLADKTRRGLRGRVEQGKSGGGIAYGYSVVKKINAKGEIIKGDREIDQAQADIIKRIFNEYAYQNKSPKAIAARLNEEKILALSGKAWGQSTINGNKKRGTGILNNELYIGRIIWNRQRFIKDPDTGKRVTRLNDKSEWIIKEVPALRIISQELWAAAKLRQQNLEKKGTGIRAKTRPKYLLSGLLKCGCCGGSFTKVNTQRYACANAYDKGKSVCSNRKTIKREKLEETVLNALQKHLMRDELLTVFCEEYTKQINSLHAAQNAVLKRQKREVEKLQKEKDALVKSLREGIPAELIKDDLIKVSAQIEERQEFLATKEKEPRPLIHPSMAKRYQQEIVDLRESLNKESSRGEAIEHLRALVEKIVLSPKAGQKELSIDLYGDLAGILTIADEDQKLNKETLKIKQFRRLIANDNKSSKESIELVAGAGFEPTTFGL